MLPLESTVRPLASCDSSNAFVVINNSLLFDYL
jgi:hypothetical protein